MIIRLITSLLILYSIEANAQIANTLWINSDEESIVFLKFEHELLCYAVDGVENTPLYLKYRIGGDTLFINSLSSGVICLGEDKKYASYLIKNAKKNMLQLAIIKDDCSERSVLLTGKQWSFHTSGVDDELNYLVISIIKDEIIVNGVRNPQKLYITDLDGNPILSVIGGNKIALNTLAKGQYILEVWDEGQLAWAKKFDRE